MGDLINKLKLRLKASAFYLLYSKVLKFAFHIFRISGGDILQLAPTTKYNRHPDLFDFCKKLKGNVTDLKILSYGCSTGEECFTLRGYFPNAAIIGCDINKFSLRKAKRINSDGGIEFIYSNELNIGKNGKYDLIFILSVLCKEPEARIVENITKIFPFTQFNKTIVTLDANLKTGGLIIIRNSNYLIEDCDIMINYSCLYKSKTEFPIFDRSGQKIKDVNGCCQIVYKKQ